MAAPAFRWTLNDQVTGEMLTFEVNPHDAAPKPLHKAISYYATTADNGQTVLFEGQDTPAVGTMNITCLTETFFKSLVYWYSKRRQVLFTDDLGQTSWIYFVTFDPTRKWSVQNPWRHEIVMTYYTLGQQAVTAQ